MVARRDLVVANDIAEMAALGWFPHEFIVYGCSYVQDGIQYYKVSSQDTELHHFKEECLKQNIYVSPIVELLNRVSVPSGMQEEYMLRTKIKLAKQLQTDFVSDWMQQFSQFAEHEGNDSAAALLFDLKDKLIGCFEREVLDLCAPIIDYAFYQKKLKIETYQELKNWLKYVYSQMEDDVVIRKNFKRIFYGFAYKTDTGQIRYITNASESEVRKRKEDLYCKGISSTPILQKTYYFENQPNLASVRDQFLAVLKQWMDEEYWWYLETIDALPVAVSVTQMEQLEQAIPAGQTMLQKQMQYYRSLWGMTDV